MKAMTLRGVGSELAEKLKRTAAEQNKSVNQLILEIINKSLGLEKDKKFSRKYSDLDNLFGRWTEDEFQQIHDQIQGDRKIDPELWT